MSLYRAPMSVMYHIDKITRDFLWSSMEGAQKFHFVDWDSACKPLDQGVLGIRFLKDVNRALLSKWLRRFGA